MAKIKYTKNELKAQTQELKRYQRFLPMLQLKKQQLQAEIQQTDQKIEKQTEEKRQTEDDLNKWVKLFSDKDVDITSYVKLTDVNTEEGNIAGVAIPVLIGTEIEKKPYDLYDTPPWVDEAVDVSHNLINMRVATDILEQQRLMITEELRTTSQRVNLFEKVKIPECKENIRVIKIYLGDEQTAAVVRGKIAKGRDS